VPEPAGNYFLNSQPKRSRAIRRSFGVGTFTFGNLSRQCQGRQASMIARLLVRFVAAATKDG
jgi:hypothetical protein